ncbi:sensor histidine kinase [Burkholderia gladioli]|uniref:sensor histidine kinase n=1 Tax=Burkholderia gladioli TaxID=28095 RepID=UPI0016419381|nr:ATP-binding protein [Burkholderia gladioli]
MTDVHFRFSPKILARLGEELNQASDQSILELVKNSYDADATLCSIELVNTTSAGGEVIIRDDGKGMTATEIRDSWLVLGKSDKESRKKTKLGRVPAGSKGLGRLAALRMGEQVSLSSKPVGMTKYNLNISWPDFDDAPTVEEVPLEIKSIRTINKIPGTHIHLKKLRSSITSEEVKRLARSLLLLTDPFEASDGFKVELKAPEFSDTEALLKKKYFEDADFHLVSNVSARGKGSVQLLDWKGEVLAEADHEELRGVGSAGSYKCSKISFDLWVFLLRGGDFLGRRASLSEIRHWLQSFGGVHVYQDGVRVTPYGNPANDWLQMNLARVRSPEERPGTNTSIGRVSITSSKKYELKQKTDRSGFIEDEQFSEIVQFLKDSLEWMARWRLKQAERRRRLERESAPKASAKERRNVELAIANAPPKIRESLKQAFSGYAKTRDKEASALRKDIQLYRTLATAGITAATFAHESQGAPIKVIGIAVNSLNGRIARIVEKDEQEKLLEPVRQISKAQGALSTLGSATLNLVKATKRRVGRVDIRKSIEDLVALLTPFLNGRDTSVTLRLAKQNCFMQGSEAALESIFANIINNSLNAFRRAGTPKRYIDIISEVTDGVCEIRISDSGPGVEDVRLADIWLPGITTNPDGTGLGLTIVADTVKDLGGEVDLIPHGSLGGAEVVVRLPILGN